MSHVVKSLIDISRGPFLVLPVTLTAAGAAAAVHGLDGAFSWWRTVLALVVAATPLSIIGAVLLGVLPALTLLGCLPALMAVPAIRWAFANPDGPVPISALGGNVVWNLATNCLLAGGLLLAAG